MRILALILLSAALPVHAQMYKCVDARGVTQYSDKPCPGGKGKEVDIRGQPPISGKLQSPGGVREAELDFRQRQLQRDREQREEAAADETQKRRCRQMRAERQRWASASRVFVTDGKGERRYLEDAEREAKLGQMDAEIARSCR